ncbi:MAG: putative Ig domain-containing protein [Synergistaceae bacterium]|nr:putative Ig domain-containing protein [Synergistaceae bacterium]
MHKKLLIKLTYHLLIITFLLLMLSTVIYAAYLRNVPVSLTQPNGDVINCFATGDEFFNYLHDENGYIIIQDPKTGYYTYAQLDDAGKIMASGEIVTTTGYYNDPNSAVYSQKAAKNIGIKLEDIDFSVNSDLIREFYEPVDKRLSPQSLVNASGIGITGPTKSGTITNVIVMICFAGDNQTIPTDIKNRIESVFNGSNQSLNHYMKAVSEGKLTLNSTLVGLNGSTALMYRDSSPRSYYQPYSVTNPNGYSTDAQRATREHTLLRNAVNAINGSPLLSGKNLDVDNNGLVDSITFFVSGSVDGKGSLFWPHKWSLYSYSVNLNGKQVYDYSFQLVDYTFPPYGGEDLSVICHETLHTFGLPDLYRYTGNGTPVGAWDVMATNTANPQLPNSHSRLRYAGWGNPLVAITTNGRYTLSPIGSKTGTTAYAIATSNPYQFILLEYRSDNNPSGYDTYFDTGYSYHKGLTITRINASYQGNDNRDGKTNDEVYVYRPNETYQNQGNGNIGLASLSSNTGRTSFGNSTSATGYNGTIYLYDNTNTKYVISDVSAAGDTITFDVQVNPPSIITTAAQLDAVRGNLRGNYRLGNDIDLTSYLAPGGAGHTKWGTEGWLPIGHESTNSEFTGSFDGNGYKITGLWINRPNAQNVGPFGYTQNATIKNVGVEIADAGIIGGHTVGGLVGHQYCNNGAGTIINCYATGNVTATSYYVGGLVGVQAFAHVNGGNNTIANCYATVNVNGTEYVGGLVGFISGNISNCYATGNVTAAGNYVGGLIGQQDSNPFLVGYTSAIEYCYATGNVSGTSDIGGLVGLQFANGVKIIANCYATGNVIGNSNVGGLVGYQNDNNGTNIITNSYRYAGAKVKLNGTPVNVTENPSGIHGGIKTASELMTKSTYTGNAWLFNDSTPTAGPWHWDNRGFPKLNFGKEELTLNSDVITITTPALPKSNVGIAYSATLRAFGSSPITWSLESGSLPPGLSLNTNTGVISGIPTAADTYNFAVKASNAVAVDTAKLSIAVYSSGNGTTANPYIITTAALLDDMRNSLNAHYILGKDIDLTNYLAPGGAGYAKYEWGDRGWMPIGDYTNRFTGILDGNGHVIKGLWIHGRSGAGLFGYTENADIKNLGVEIAPAGIKGGYQVGGLVGQSSSNGGASTIANCYIMGDVTATDDSYGRVGGLVGEQYSSNNGINTIVNCYVKGNIRMGDKYRDIYSGNGKAGGLVGLQNTNNSGAYSGSNTIINCYATCNVGNSTGGYDYAGGGGLVGEQCGGSIENCYFTGNVSGGYYISGGLVGRQSNGVNSITNSYRYEGTAVTANTVPVNMTDNPNGIHGGIKTAVELMAKATYTANKWQFHDLTGPWYWDDRGFPKLNIGVEEFPFSWQPLVTIPIIAITAQPAANTTVTAGRISGSLSVSASVSPNAALAYQWYSNMGASNSGGTAISGATSRTFTIPTNLTAGNYYYYCVVSANNADSVPSNAATVTVILDPNNNATINGQTIGLAGNASGLGWSWNANSNTLTLTGGDNDLSDIVFVTNNNFTINITGNTTAGSIVNTGTGNIKITGNTGRSLTLNSTTGPAISNRNDIEISGGTIYAVTHAVNTDAIASTNGAVNISGTANVTAETVTGEGAAISAAKNINISTSGNVRATTDMGYSLEASAINITNGATDMFFDEAKGGNAYNVDPKFSGNAAKVKANEVQIYPVVTGNTPVIGEFYNPKWNNTKNFFTITKNASGVTVITYNKNPNWNNSFVADVSGYTAASASEYPWLVIKASFVGTKYLCINLPDNTLLWTDFSGAKKNDDGSYTFNISLAGHAAVKSKGISDIHFFLDMDVKSFSDTRSMTIHEISFRKDIDSPKYIITPSESGTYTFPATAVGYSQAPAARTITVANNGDVATSGMTIQLQGENPNAFTASAKSLSSIAVRGSRDFTIRPTTGLKAGTYTSLIQIGNEHVLATFNVSFTVSPAGAGGRPVISEFKNHKDNSNKSFYAISKNASGQTVITYSKKPTWDNLVYADVSGYTAASASEYTRLCVTATFAGTKQFAVELPYSNQKDNLELLWSEFEKSGVMTKNTDGSYTFDMPLSKYADIKSKGISSIMLFLDPEASVSGTRSMTIIDIGFRKNGEPAIMR